MHAFLKALTEFLQTLTFYIRVQTQIKCKHCGRTYERLTITNSEKKNCDCGLPLDV